MPRLSDSDNDDYTSTARFLSNTSDEPAEQRPRSISRPTRRQTDNTASDRLSFVPPRWSRITSSASDVRSRVLATSPFLTTIHDRALSLWKSLTPPQRVLLLAGLTIVGLFGLLTLIYHDAILSALRPTIETWRRSKVAWLLPFGLIVVVSFPPLVGYSTLCLLSGFLFGLWRGFAIVAPATVLGSSLSFVVSRAFLSSYTSRLAASDARFKALSLTLKHDGLKLLVMIRLCPLPYSLSNAAISSVPGVGVGAFAIATALATPRLLVSIFIGSRLGMLAGDEGEKMDVGSRVASYVSIAVGVGVAIGTGWFMYTRVQKRAKELEELERRGQGGGGDEEQGGIDGEQEYGYDDWADDEVRPDDGISLHTAAEDDPAEGEGHSGNKGVYRDTFSDDDAGDARSLDAVFSAGDDSGDEGQQYKDHDSSTK